MNVRFFFLNKPIFYAEDLTESLKDFLLLLTTKQLDQYLQGNMLTMSGSIMRPPDSYAVQKKENKKK